MQHTQMQNLSDAVLYLYQYPYSCSEQIASKILALVATSDIVEAFAERKGESSATQALRNLVAKYEKSKRTIMQKWRSWNMACQK